MDIINIHDYELVRNADGFYSLGNEELDHALGLDQNTYVSAPPQNSVENFTALAYIYGLMGYTTTNFTACPSGFIVTFKKGDKIATFNTNESFLSRNRSLIIKDLGAYTNDNIDKLNHEEVYTLGQLAGIIFDKNNPLLKTCINANCRLEEHKDETTTLRANRDLAASPFEYKEGHLNYINCQNNHELIRRMCRAINNCNIDGIDLTEEQIKNVNELYDKVLNKTILRYYGNHIGVRTITKDGVKKQFPIRQDFEILSAPYVVRELLDLVKSRGNLGLVTTIAATDFSADIVFAALNALTSCTKVEEGEKALKKVIPDTPYAYEHDKNMREILTYWTRHNQGPHRVR